MDDHTLLLRVRKLMDKALSTTNAHESEVFSLKAAELITRHRLDPDRIRTAHAGAELGVRDVPLGRGAYVRARLALLTSVAEAHDAQVIHSSTPTGMVAHVAGFTSDLDVIEVMYNSLHQQASTQMAGIRRATPAATQRFRRSFLFGYAVRVGELLVATRRQVEEHGVDGGDLRSAELATLDRVQRVNEHVARTFPKVRAARMPSAAQVGAWSAGSAAAERADVGRTRIASRPAIGPG